MKLTTMALMITVALALTSQAKRVNADSYPITVVPPCTAAAWTGPDHTPIVMVEIGVSPPEALTAIWKFDGVSGEWLGFSPKVPPGLNTLTSVNYLDVVFICVNQAASWNRPIRDPSYPKQDSS